MAFVIPILVSAAISAAASYVISSVTKKSPKTVLDNKPTTLAARGSVIPKIIGHVRVGYIFAWAGNRVLVNPPSGGGGGSGLGGGSTTVSNYFQPAWHQICVGPADNLYGIYQNGKLIYANQLSRIDTSSGSTFRCLNNQGTFSIYWGECNQPVNTFLGSKQQNGSGQPLFPGILSRWPKCCYILWHDKNLGSTSLWPQLEYEIECRIDTTATTLVDSPAWLASTTTMTDGLPNGNDGVNPAHALWMLITAPFPDGAGVDPSVWNLSLADFESLGVLCETEHITCNYCLTQGQDINSAISDLMQDVGFFLAQNGDTLVPTYIRAISDPTTIPTLDDTVNTSPNPELERVTSLLITDRPQFLLSDRGINFHDFTINFGNDAVARQNQRPRITSVKMSTITDRYTGYIVSERRRLEYLDRQTFKVNTSRQGRLLQPGQAFNLITADGSFGVMRTTSVKVSTTTSSADIECVLDQYTLAATGLTYGNLGELLIDAGAALPDILVVPFVLPVVLRPNGGLIYIGIARVRNNDAISGAAVWCSVDGGTSYQQIGEQDIPAAGGTLNSPLLASVVATESSPLTVGPSITPYNDDIQNALDLSSNPLSWKKGTLVCMIDTEVFFLESVSAVAGGYQLNGLIRGQYDTPIVDHLASAPVVIFGEVDISRITSGLFTAGSTIYIKTVPFTADNVVDITTVTAVPLVIDGNVTASITLVAPSDSDISVSAGFPLDIRWKTHGNTYTIGGPPFTGNIDIFYSLDGGTTFATVILNVPDTGLYTWTPPSGISSTTAVIRVASHVTPTLFDDSNYDFTITDAPVLTLTSPSTGAESWQVGSRQTITWTEVPVIGHIDIQYSPDSTTWTNIATDLPNTGSFIWTVGLYDASTTAYIKVLQTNLPAIHSESPSFNIHT